MAKGFRVKATVVFKGREITHEEFGNHILEKMIVDLTGIGKIETPLKKEGKRTSIIFSKVK